MATDRNIFGLDIGLSTMKAVALNNTNNTRVLRSCISFPTPPKGMMSEAPLDQQTMAQSIQKMIEEGQLMGYEANIAFPDNQAFTKIIEMPLLSDKELSSAIYWEAEQHIPMPLNTMTLVWDILEKDNPAQVMTPKMRVLLVASPTSLLNRYQNIFSLSGIKLAAVETEILAATRSIVTGENFPNSLIVNISSLSTSLAIIKNGVLNLTHVVPLGSVALNRAIATDFGFTLSQAEEYKKIYGITDRNLGGKIGRAIEPILNTLLTEIKKALSLYNEKNHTAAVTQVILAGGTAKLPGINIFFVENLGVETLAADPWKAHNITGVPPDLVEKGSEYAVAVGLSLKEYE